MFLAVMVLMIACGVKEESICNNGEWKAEAGVVSECVENIWVMRRITRQWGTLYNDAGSALTMDAKGNFYVAGGAIDDNEEDKYDSLTLIKWNQDGTKAWSRSWSTDKLEMTTALATDPHGGIYVVGSTTGKIDDNVCAGRTDAFLIKWNDSGVKEWSKEWGTNEDEIAYAVTLDATSNIYITGMTRGSLDGNVHDGRLCGEYGDGAPLPCGDIFLTKWDKYGTKLWTRQWGSSGGNEGRAISVDSTNNVYVAGRIGGEQILVKWSSDGEKLWSKTFDWMQIYSLLADSTGNVYVSGNICDENISDCHIFLTKISKDGDIEWTKRWGNYVEGLSPQALSLFVANDSEYVYVTGSIWGDWEERESSGGHDVFITKWDAKGNNNMIERLWGTEEYDAGTYIKVDGAGDIYVVGWTNGGIDGNATVGGKDLFFTQWLVE